MDEKWRDEEPTQNQIDYIHKMGKKLKQRNRDHPLTRGEASDMIDTLKQLMSHETTRIVDTQHSVGDRAYEN